MASRPARVIALCPAVFPKEGTRGVIPYSCLAAASIFPGQDTRPHSPKLAGLALSGIKLIGGQGLDQGILTTPMLHHCVRSDCRHVSPFPAWSLILVTSGRRLHGCEIGYAENITSSVVWKSNFKHLSRRQIRFVSLRLQCSSCAPVDRSANVHLFAQAQRIQLRTRYL